MPRTHAQNDTQAAGQNLLFVGRGLGMDLLCPNVLLSPPLLYRPARVARKEEPRIERVDAGFSLQHSPDNGSERRMTLVRVCRRLDQLAETEDRRFVKPS
jgi:hypothetical protein